MVMFFMVVGHMNLHMDMEFIDFQMGMSTLVSFRTIIVMEKESTHDQMEQYTRVSGSMEKDQGKD